MKMLSKLLFVFLFGSLGLFAQMQISDTLYFGSNLCDVAVDEINNIVYCSDETDNCVYVINGNTNTIVDTILLPGSYPNSLAISKNTNHLFVCYYSTDSVSVIDCGADSLVVNVPVNSPLDVCVNGSTNSVYIACWDEDTSVTVFEDNIWSIIGTINAGGNSNNICINETTNKCYAILQDDKETVIIDGSTNAIMDTIQKGYRGIEVNETTNEVFLADIKGGSPDTSIIFVVDGNTDKIIDSLRVKGQIVDLCVNEGDNRVYCATENPGFFWVLDGITNTVSDSMEVEAFQISLNSVTGSIYVTTYDSILYILNDLSGIGEDITPGLFSLSPAEPNPFITKTTVRYELGKTVKVDISVYNMLGQKVRDLFSGRQSPGVYSVNWDGLGNAGEKLSSGIYFVRVEAEDKEASRKVTLVK